MSYDFYRIIHVTFLSLLLLSLGGLWALHSLKEANDKQLRRYLLLFHGISALFIFIAGFGLIARLQIKTPWPLWIYIKMILWLIIVSFPFILRKTLKGSSRRLKSRMLWWVLGLLVFFAILTARLKFS